MNIFIGFDFSINKPAMTIYKNSKYEYYIWPLKLSENKIKLYKESDIHILSRELDSISELKHLSLSELTLEHTARAINLANIIVSDIKKELKNINNYSLYICSEGLSFGSNGDAALNLATYKGILLSKLYENFYNNGLKGLYTYSPISIKSIAGCAKKQDRNKKVSMINAFIAQKDNNCLFKENLINKKLLAKSNYIPCVDDIVDSYWALKTMIKKENLI